MVDDCEEDLEARERNEGEVGNALRSEFHLRQIKKIFNG